MAAGSRLTSRVLTGGSAPRTCLPATAAGTARLAWVDGIGTPIQKSASVAADVTVRPRGGPFEVRRLDVHEVSPRGHR
jgi:hypothetical protein